MVSSLQVFGKQMTFEKRHENLLLTEKFSKCLLIWEYIARVKTFKKTFRRILSQ